MRAEGVYRLILNASLFSGMRCTLAQDPKFIKFSVVEGGVPVHHLIKVSSVPCIFTFIRASAPILQVGNAKISQDLLDTIHANIPHAPSAAGGSAESGGV